MSQRFRVQASEIGPTAINETQFGADSEVTRKIPKNVSTSINTKALQLKDATSKTALSEEKLIKFDQEAIDPSGTNIGYLFFLAE